MNNKISKSGVKYTPSRNQIENEHFQRRLWMSSCSLLPDSRRKALDEIAATIYDYDGLIFTEDGRLWPIPEDFETIFCQEGRGLDTYREEGKNGIPKRRVRNLNRLIVLYLYFSIKYPEIALKIAK